LTPSRPRRRTRRWWIAGNKRQQVSGTLHVNCAEKIELDLYDRLPKSLWRGFIAPTQRQTFFGEDDHGRPLSLHNCYSTRSKGDRVTYHVGSVFANAHIRQLASLRFKTGYVSMTTLEEWIGTEPMQSSNPAPNQFCIESVDSQPVKVNLPKEKLALSVAHALRTEWKRCDSQSIAYHSFVKMEPKKPFTLEEFSHLVTDVSRLIMLLSGEPNSYRLTGGDLLRRQGRHDEEQIDDTVYLFRALTEQTEVRQVFTPQMIFPLPEIKDRLDDICTRWLPMARKLRPVFNVLFAELRTRSRFLESHFFHIAQCAEAYHRSTTGRRDLAFRKRVQQLFSSLESPTAALIVKPKEQDRFITAVKDTRNLFTHLDEKPKAHIFPRHQWYAATNRLLALLFIHMLRECGFPEPQIIARMKASQRFGVQPFEFAQKEEGAG
jgi:ApeA N-terminal domain 1/Apea-like HEPN